MKQAKVSFFFLLETKAKNKLVKDTRTVPLISDIIYNQLQTFPKLLQVNLTVTQRATFYLAINFAEMINWIKVFLSKLIPKVMKVSWKCCINLFYCQNFHSHQKFLRLEAKDKNKGYKRQLSFWSLHDIPTVSSSENGIADFNSNPEIFGIGFQNFWKGTHVKMESLIPISNAKSSQF